MIMQRQTGIDGCAEWMIGGGGVDFIGEYSRQSNKLEPLKILTSVATRSNST